MKKLVFLVNSISDAHCIKRILDFKQRGYDFDVYGFNRGIYDCTIEGFNYKIIGEFSEGLSYIRRFPLYYKAIKKVVDLYKKEDIYYYYFGLDIALVATLLSMKPYIYEECDLVHTYVRNKTVRFLLDRADKSIIKRAKLTALTSKGYAIYHFGAKQPKNVVIVPNKLSEQVKSIPLSSRDTNIDKLSIGFVGGVRFKSIISFANYYVKNFPNYEFHIFGIIDNNYLADIENLKKHSNCFIHGRFRSPDDLSSIYSQIDLVLSTYDVEIVNVKYAEPNKLYESIYYETPIIVSKGTFLSERVNELGVGFSVDALNEDDVKELISGLSIDVLNKKKSSAAKLTREFAINDASEFFEKIELLEN